MPVKFNELLLKPDIIELYNEGITPNYGYLMNGRFEKDMVKTIYPLKALSGNPISWEASDTEYLFPIVSLEPKQAGSGDPSPENVRPISGWDEVSVNVRGKNVLDITGAYRHFFNYVLPNAMLVSGATYTFSVPPTLSDGETAALFCIADNYAFTQYLSKDKNQSFTVPSGLDFSQGIWIAGGSATALNGVEPEDFMVELGSTPTPYEPYQPGTTATLAFPETIYGGTADAVTGVGEKTWEFVKFDGTEDFIFVPIEKGVQISYRLDDKANISKQSESFCSHYGYGVGVLGCFWIESTGIFVRFFMDGFSTVDEWKSYLAAQAAAGTPVQVVYKLATPTSFQATGNQQLTSLLGYNTIYTDGDSMVLNRKARRLEV